MDTKKYKVAIQGIKASFHDEAATKYFGPSVEIIECPSFKDSCEVLNNNESDFAVMAIENSVAGSLLSNYSLLQEYDFSIVGEVTLPIKMYLLALPGVKLADIKYIQSHPIAIRQCNDFLNDHPEILILEKNDTSACAKEIRDKGLKDTAAIASLAAAKLFDLEVLESRVESNKKNFTRFLVLSAHKMEVVGANKASLVFQVKNEIGSLAKVLEILALNNIDLSKIQSIPVLGKPDRYNFYIDIHWKNMEDYQEAIPQFLPYTSNLTIMGLYKNNHFIRK
jgi:prephenate dehydratase